MSRLPTSRDCVICGRDNPVGVRIQFQPVPGGVEATATAPVHFQGFGGVLHGGIVSGILDDAMWWATYAEHGVVTMTADLNVRFREPVPVDAALQVQGRVVEARRTRLFTCTAEIARDGKVLAEATGRFLRAPAAVADALVGGMRTPGQNYDM